MKYFSSLMKSCLLVVVLFNGLNGHSDEAASGIGKEWFKAVSPAGMPVGSAGSIVIPDVMNSNQTLQFETRCYGTNLRHVHNPLNPLANIEADLLFLKSVGSSAEVMAAFRATLPAQLTATHTLSEEQLTQIGSHYQTSCTDYCKSHPGACERKKCNGFFGCIFKFVELKVVTAASYIAGRDLPPYVTEYFVPRHRDNPCNPENFDREAVIKSGESCRVDMAITQPAPRPGSVCAMPVRTQNSSLVTQVENSCIACRTCESACSWARNVPSDRINERGHQFSYYYLDWAAYWNQYKAGLDASYLNNVTAANCDAGRSGGAQNLAKSMGTSNSRQWTRGRYVYAWNNSTYSSILQQCQLAHKKWKLSHESSDPWVNCVKTCNQDSKGADSQFGDFTCKLQELDPVTRTPKGQAVTKSCDSHLFTTDLGGNGAIETSVRSMVKTLVNDRVTPENLPLRVEFRQVLAGGKATDVSSRDSTVVLGTDGNRIDTHRPYGIQVSSTGEGLRIVAEFPGAGGFCGGYYSPLMLFFDHKRPAFSGASQFLRDGKGDTYWVEAASPGYLLALDNKNRRTVDSSTQLFGANTEFSDGFQALRVFDADREGHKDGRIDENDRVYEKLILWNDRNGDGKSDPSEIFTLRELNVVSIDLNYDPSFRQYFGERAEARGRSAFVFKDSKSGKTNHGVVVDVWFKDKKSR